MAGAGYKLFNTGDVLTAAQVNTYLQEQVVMVFADAAARTTALSGVLAEGMLSYLKDTDAVQYYNGSAWTTINTDQTPLTTKGDLFTFSTTDARLGVGSNGETLVADSAATTGLRWQTSVNANGVINGGMDIWQRGTSFAIPSSTYTYTADRWIGLRFSTGSTVSQQTASLDGFQYSIRVARDSGNTGTGIIYLGYNVETADSYRYAGKTATFSFWAKAGANFSAASSALAVVWASGTGTNQKQMDGFTGQSLLANTTVTLTTSWQRFSFTASVPSNSTQQGFQFNFTPVGTAGAADNFEIVGVQLEYGSVATNFKRAGGTIQGELAACQRYYWRFNSSGHAYQVMAFGQTRNTTTDVNFTFPAPVPMRVVPTSVDYSTLRAVDGATGFTISTLTISTESNSWMIKLDGTSTSLPTYRPMVLSANNSTSAYLGLSAEL